MAVYRYTHFRTQNLKGKIDIENLTIKLMFVTNSYVPDVSAHSFRSSVSAFEIPATGGYTAGGFTLANKTFSWDFTNNRPYLDFDDLALTNCTISTRGHVLYVARGGAATADELILYEDYEGLRTTNNTNFTIVWPSTGVLIGL